MERRSARFICGGQKKQWLFPGRRSDGTGWLKKYSQNAFHIPLFLIDGLNLNFT
jgi:hypothetical protein